MSEPTKYLTHNDCETTSGGNSWLHGYINIDYKQMVKLFGKPREGEDRSDAEWTVQFQDEEKTTASIYNWKDGKNYCGRMGTLTTKIAHWHIGSSTYKAVDLIKAVVDNDNAGKPNKECCVVRSANTWGGKE